MFLLYEYEIFWAFLIISSVIPILAFLVSGILAPINKGPEKLSSYETGIEPMGDAWLQFRIRTISCLLAKCRVPSGHVRSIASITSSYFYGSKNVSKIAFED